jgi:hypothetical protein
MALDGSYALNRFMIWAMPILGFLGTVLGITEAISNLSPEQMATNPAAVSDGLTKAFDATALALSLTLVTMFCNYLVEKLEQGLLERVDHYVDAELAHRFVRSTAVAGESGAPIPALQIEKLSASLQVGIEASLTRFGQRIVETEKKLLERHHALIEMIAKLAAGMNDSSQNHQVALSRLTDAIGLSVEMITKVQSNEAQLNRLQESLSQNLALLANSATFEQAVESLTAAIHLLTTRVNPASAATPRIVPMSQKVA